MRVSCAAGTADVAAAAAGVAAWGRVRVDCLGGEVEGLRFMGQYGMIGIVPPRTRNANGFFVAVSAYPADRRKARSSSVSGASCWLRSWRNYLKTGLCRSCEGCTVIEEWKALDKTNGYYEISNWGRVRRAKPGVNTVVGQIIKQGTNGWGYAFATVKDGKGGRVSFCVHTCVAEMFFGPKPAEHVVNHIDGNKKNNRVDNLEYVTVGGNLKHAYTTGLRGPKNSGGMIGEDHPRAKLTASDVIDIRREYQAGECTQKKLAERYGVSTSAIADILSGRHWRQLNARDASAIAGAAKSAGTDAMGEAQAILADIERAANAVLSANEKCSKSSMALIEVQRLLRLAKGELEQATDAIGMTIEERMNA